MTAALGIGLAAGAAIGYVDNIAFAGEVSPIVIVAMLAGVAAVASSILGRAGWIIAAVSWICVPLAHLVKHALALPDTLQPNTYGSIAMLAAFTFVVTAVGFGAGAFIYTVRSKTAGRLSERP